MKEFRNKNVKSVFGGIGVAALLCVLMVLMSWSAMVTNSDINSVDNDVNVSTLDEPVDNDLDADENNNERYDPAELGFDESNELVGMRTESSKTYLRDGGMFEVHSLKPLHYKAANGQFVELDTTIKSFDHGYYVQDIYTPVTFFDDVNQGFVMEVSGGELIHSGLNLEPVLITQQMNNQLPGVRNLESTQNVETIEPKFFSVSDEPAQIGGSSLSYPLTDLIELQYHVSENQVKQEFVIEGFTSQLDEMLSEASHGAMFGFKENVELPEGAEVWTGNFKLADNGELVQYNGRIAVVDSTTGKEIAFIAAPFAYDNSQQDNKEVTLLEDKEVDETGTTYYLSIEEGTNTLEIITAVNADWLVDDNTIFPVVIDPQVGSNTEQSDTAAGSYRSCDVAAVDCYTDTDGYYAYDWSVASGYSGYHTNSPMFDFTFTQGTSLSVGQVKAFYEVSSTTYVSSYDRAGLIIMEDCGATVNPDGDTDDLASFANPSGCGGVTDANGVTSPYTPLPSYTPPAPPAGAPVTYYFSDSTNNFAMDVLYNCDGDYGSPDPNYDVTSDMTSCYYGYVSYDFIYPNNGPDESGGIFIGGQTYDFTVHDSYGDGIDDGLVVFQTRTAATASSAAGTWTDAYLIGDYGNIGATAPYTNTFTNGPSYDSQITVASTDEMRLVYHCSHGGWDGSEGDCYGEETYVTLKRGTPVPTLSAVAAGTTPGSPTGGETPSTTFTIASGEEAIFEFTVGTQPGDADETEIYWRTAGATSWTNVWDLCDASVNAANCVGGQQYISSSATPPIVVQTPGTYEVLVWDTAGDGSGTPGASGIGGQVTVQTVGTGGVAYVSPSGQRLVSLISSEQIAQLTLGETTPTNPNEVVVCSGVTSCNSGPMSMFVDAYQNGGYVEFGLGWYNAPNGLGGSVSNEDSYAYFDNFYLVVDLEDTTPDTSIPTVVNTAHYDGITSYVDGERTLFLSLTDVENGILYLPNGATYEGPQLHYTLDGNTYQTVDSTLQSATCQRNEVCTFSATTDPLSAGDTVGYYWTYSDSAQNDNTKIPAQTPNPGRFPAAGANDLTFTIADIFTAPLTTSAKLTTLLEDLTTADYDPSGKYGDGYYDRQMTYYTESGEYHVEFDFSECSGGYAYSTPGDMEYNCLWDADFYGVGDQGLGHWDINWEGAAGSCYPGATGCTGAPTNTQELDSHFGGMVDVNWNTGTDNLLFSYDATANAWAVAGAGTGIANRLTSADSTALSYTANIVTPPSPITITQIADGGVSGKGPYAVTPTFNVPSGEVGRIELDCRSWCSEVGMTIIDVTTPTAPIVYNVGNTNGATEQTAYNSASYVTSASGSGFGSSSSTGVWVTDNLGSINSNLPTLIPAGDYEYYEWDDYGDGTSTTVTLETVSASTGFTGVTAVPPYDATAYESSSNYNSGSNTYTGEAFIIDFAATGMPTLTANDGFGGVPFGTNAGEFNQMCVTTSGLVIFMEATGSNCIPDVDASSAGGSWQGFALGASVTTEDWNDNGLLWQYSNVQPDPDTTAPQIDGGVIGDSHALARTITATISDNAVGDFGVNTSPVPGTGPTVYVTVTAEDGTVSNDILPMTIDSGDENSCVADACSWSADIDNLVRGDSVTYYITANDMYPPGANTAQTSDYTFEVGNPTNTLVVEWHEYLGSTSTFWDACTVQVIMYDVTNEFEYHYDENCETFYHVGVVGARESPTNFIELFNPRSNGNYHYDNPLPENNYRFTYIDATNSYVVETFDRGITTSLSGLSGTQQGVQAASGTFGADVDCASASRFASHIDWCAGNIDIPDDFNFEFYGKSYDGADSNNRIHMLSTGMMHFIDNGGTSRVQVQQGTSSASGCWVGSGVSCLMSTTDPSWPSEPLMAPYWSRETMDYCHTNGGRDCEGVLYRTMPFDGQGKVVAGDIVDDTTWYLLDSPIKVNPTSADGYLSVMADLTIEAGVEVIIGENKGISFDGGLQSDGTCAQMTVTGTSSERVTFDADRSVNPAALWHGLAFTDKCGTAGEADRHTFDKVDFSNTNHAAITAGSRPADPNGPSCGDAQNDCDVGEFDMTDVTFTNVDSAFAHGSGQGTVVTMSNFAVTDARSACFNFAENTIATLTGTAQSPSTMTRCNNNQVHWGGAVVNQPGSNGGELTMSYVNIVDSYVSLIRVDLQKVYLNDISATNTNDDKQAPEADSGNQAWSDENGGVNLALSFGTNGEAVITNFDAQNYHHGWICATSVVQLNNVNLGAEWVSGFTPDASRGQPTPGDQYFNIDPTCGFTTNAQGATGVNAVFDDVTAPSLTMYRTFPGTANMITTSGDLKIAEFPTGTYTSGIEVTQATTGGKFIVDGCNADMTLSDSSAAQVSSLCSAFQGTSSLTVLDSSITHDDSIDNATTLEQTTATLVNVDITSTTVTATGPYYIYAGYDSTIFAIDVNVDSMPCADTNGKTAECLTGKDSTGFGTTIPEIYYGGFAEVNAYRLGLGDTQILEPAVTIVASTLDSTGAEVFPGKTIYSTITDSSGTADKVAVVTGNDEGVTYDQHHIRASGAAGAGEAHPLLADGTPATEVQFVDGVPYQAPAVLAVNAYTMGNDISFTDGVTLLDAITTYASGNAPAGTLTWSWQSADPSTTGSFDPDQDTSTGRVYWKSIAYADATVLTGTNGYDRIYYGGEGVAAGNDINGPVTAATETYNFVSFDDEFGTYTIGSVADVRLLSPPVTFDDSNMNCAWMSGGTNTTFATAYDAAEDAFIFKGATMVLADSMNIDGCTVKLIGSKMIFRDSSLNPSITITAGGSLVMEIDGDTGDLPKIYGEGNLDAVDIILGAQGTLDMQAGSIKNFKLTGKSAQLTVPSDANLMLAGGAYLTSSDLTTVGGDYPMIHADGGIVTVSSAATLAGAGGLGIGVKITNSGELNGDGLTVSNMKTGIDSFGGALDMDSFTSNGNKNGLIAQDGPKLPQMFRSATLQGMLDPIPRQAPNAGNYPIGFDNCIDPVALGNALQSSFWASLSPSDIHCVEWRQYTVDLSSWIGETDYLQPAMQINYDGHSRKGMQNLVGGIFPYSSYIYGMSMDNMQVVITDNTGAQYVIDDATDAGYYPWGTGDSVAGANYQGGLGGLPNWDCNEAAESWNPYTYGNNDFNPGSNWNTYSSLQSGYTYPDDFGFRIIEGDDSPGYSTSRPKWQWGYYDQFFSAIGPGSFTGTSYMTNPSMYHDTPIGQTGTAYSQVCGLQAYNSQNGAFDSNMILEWPTLDLTDPSIAKVELQFDFMHDYEGAFVQSASGMNNNQDADGLEVLIRSGSNPAAFGDYSNEIIGKGVSLTNSDIDDAEVGVDFRGNLIGTLQNVNFNDPVVYAVRTSGLNDLTLDGLNVVDAAAGSNNNYGFYTETVSSGAQSVTNSNFNGVGTAIYLTNSVDTTISNTAIINGDTGIEIGSSSSADHVFDTVTLTNNNLGIAAGGIGTIKMNDVDVTSLGNDLEITGGNTISFLDGTIDQNKVSFSSSSIGTLDRDRSFVAVITADGNPIADASVGFSSRAIGESTTGYTDSTGETSGLKFSVYDLDVNGVTDYTANLDTYSLSTVAEVAYSWTDSTVNDGDFRYIQASYPEIDPQDSATDSVNSVNHVSLSLVDTIDARVCSNDATDTVVSPCAGTLSSSGNRVFANGMVEYGSNEGLHDGTSTMDLSNSAVMIDAGNFELRDGVELILDNSVVFATGFNDFTIAHNAWISDVPYGAQITMDGGEISGSYPLQSNGQTVGLLIGGYWGSTENALNLDINNVVFNNVAGIATGTGDRTSSASTGSYNTYIPSTVEITNSYFNHYRGFFFAPTSIGAVDMCLRFSGVDGAVVSGNTFSDCTIGVAFMPSQITTTNPHDLIGSDNMVIDGNTFNGASSHNIWAYADADVDMLTLSNNDMSCSTCTHVYFWDDSSLAPTITGNTFTGGDAGVSTITTEFVTINNNIFNNQEDYAIIADGGDFSIDGNTINNPGEYGIYANSLEKPSEVIQQVIAGINSPQPDNTVNFATWTTDCFLYYSWWWGPVYSSPCLSPDVTAVLGQGEEMVISQICGSYCYELTVNYKDPNNNLGTWDAGGTEGLSHNHGTPNIVFNIPGTYTFNLEDSYGDGADGGGFEIIKAAAGSFTAGANTNPIEYWDPGVNGLQTTQPGSYSGYGYSTSYYGASGCSKDMDGIIIQNTGTDPVYYEMTGLDTAGDGWEPYGATFHNGAMMFYEAPIGTWTPQTQSGPSWNSCQQPTLGSYIGGINDGAFGLPGVDFYDGSESPVETVVLQPGYEMHFRFWCYRYCGEANLKIQEAAAVDNSWVGPTITNNVINFDSVNNNPLAVGMYLSNCDVLDYSILTEANTINIGQNAVWNDGCIWNDKDSVITGSNLAGSIGYDDDNQLGADITLDGTTISGFETGVYKTNGGAMFVTGDAQITAGDGGYGILTDGIDVTVTGATFDGGSTGTGAKISNSAYSWLYPMDVTGNVGLHAVNSEIFWDQGAVDADTILIAETVTGTVQSLTDPASGGGAGPASASSTTMIDARTDTRLTVVDWPLDENRMLVDSTTIIEESNWLSIDANHLGDEPNAAVGVSIISDQNSDAYSSPIFENSMNIDGSSDDWVGGNALNPSGYAMPGNIGGPMYVTVDAGDLVLGLDGVSTATSDVYVYIDSNDFAGTNTGFNGVHTLPYAADYVIVADSTGSSVHFFNDPSWQLNPTSNIVSDEDTMLEIRVPLSSISGSSVDSLNFVAVVQNQGTDDVTAVVPTQTTVGTGAETFTEAYDMELNKLDLNDGTLNNEVLLYRSFTFSNVPSAGHTYQVMVKTAAEARHTCDYDWATTTAVTMDVSQSLSFDILRACPEITTSLADVQVLEDTGAVTFDLASFVDDEQDVEASMLWSVTEVANSMDAYDGILSNFNGPMVDATGTFDLTPINDQFGTFELTFEVVDSHGQNAVKTILYTVLNVNDAPVICDARSYVDPDCDTGDVYLYSDPDPQNPRFNSRDEGFTSYSKTLGNVANITDSFIRDMANEQFPVNQVYTWNAAADCDQMSIVLADNANGVPELTLLENQNWEQGGICNITLDLSDDGIRGDTQATSVVVPFTVAPKNDLPVIATAGQVTSTDASNSFTGELDGNYRVTLVEDTTESDSLTFDLSGIKSDIDHLDADLTWTLEDTNTCTSSNYYSHSITGDTLSFNLIADATTNAEPWEKDMLNNNGLHQTRTPNGYCEMTLTLSDTENAPVNMPNGGTGANYSLENSYDQGQVSVTLSVKVDNVVENVPDYFLDGAEGFDFNGVNNIMPGTWVPVDFSINAGGDEGPYTYDHLLKVSLQTNGHTETQLPRLYTPPAYGTSLDIDDWEVYMTDQTTEVWVEVDVVTCNPGQVCTPASNDIQTDTPVSHTAATGTDPGKWSEPGRIGESSDGTNTQQSNRRPAFEDKNWCNNLMTSNAAGTSVAWSDAGQCGHTEQGYSGQFVEDWQTGGNALPIRVTTIGALSVASFAPSIIAVALTGMFVSALVFAGRRDDDEEEFMEETMSEDESAVSPVIATILMVAITVVLSGVVYVWAAQLADQDTKGVPVITFSAENVDTGNTDTDHWKITIGQAQTVLATQAVEVVVDYTNAAGGAESQRINLASTDQVYGFSPYNSDSLVTFGDVVTLDGDETISTFSTGDDIYVKTHLSDGTPLVDATIRIVYNPPGDTDSPTLKTYRGMNWNQPV